MSIFTNEEINLICVYDPGNRTGTIYELRDMVRYLMPDEEELQQLAESVIEKLEDMTDDEYNELSDELTPDTFDSFDDEDSAYGGYFTFTDIDPDAEIE